MLVTALLLSLQVSTPFPNPCNEIGGENLRLECAFILADEEWERVEVLLERARVAVSQAGPDFGFDVAAELRASQVEWEDYADGACAAVAHRAGPPESYEGYHAFFQCRRQMNFERANHLWSEYLRGSGEAQPTPIVAYDPRSAPPRPARRSSP